MKKGNIFFKLTLAVILATFTSYGLIAGNRFSMEFNGSNESVFISNASGLNVTDKWTFEAWIYVNSVSAYDDFMFRNGIFSFQVKNPLGSGDFAVDFYNRDNGSELSTGASGDLTFNTWYHVAATFDGSTAKLYVNNNLVDSDATASNWILQTNSENFNIAARYISGYSNYFDGQIDEIRLSDVARSISDMQTHYRREEYSVDGNTLLLMHFNDQADPATYITGTGFSGTVNSHNVDISNYKDSEIVAARLLQPNYRSQASGNWNTPASWQYYNGTTLSWENATLCPDFYDDTITVISSHTIAVTGDISVNQLIINAGGTLNVSSGITVTLKNGPGTDLDVYGTIKKSGTILRSSGATIVVENGGKYQHDTDGSISTATWVDGSTCEIIGVGSGTTLLNLGNTGQNFDNFTWNVPTQNRDVAMEDFTDTYGDFTLITTNGYELQLNNSTTDKQINIGGNGDFILQGGTLNIASGAENTYFVVYNNFTQTGGTLTSTGTGTGYLRFGRLYVDDAGTFSKTGGTLTPDDIQVNKHYSLTLNSDWDVGSIPFNLLGKMTVNPGKTLSFDSTFTIYSTANYQGSLINYGTVSDNIKVQCYLTSQQWYGISAPVDNQQAGVFYLGGSPDVWMKKYNEESNSYSFITDITTDLQDMHGWFVWLGGSSSHTFEFDGPVRTGTVGSNNNLIRTTDTTGYNFVGNPFPSAIDWDAASGWTKTNIENAIYIYNNGNWATYINGTGTNGGSSHIAMNQGFFVQVSDGGGPYPEYGTLKMTSDVCVHSDTAFMKITPGTQKIIRLQINDGNLKDETVIRVTENASEGWDGNLDAHKLFSFNPQIPQIFSTGNGFMSINSIPPGVKTVPLDVKGVNGNLLTVSLMQGDDFENIFLYDNLTAQITDLKKEAYSFTYDESFANRFVLSFLVTDLSDKKTGNKKFNVFARGKTVEVVFNDISKAEIIIYNLLGQEITRKNTTSRVNNFSISETGYYIVKVKGERYSTSKKVFIR